jgi:hypothetical protein
MLHHPRSLDGARLVLTVVVAVTPGVPWALAHTSIASLVYRIPVTNAWVDTRSAC